jgi:hypothetical protein
MCLYMRVPMACHVLSCKLDENLLYRSVQLFGLEQKTMSLFSLNSRVKQRITTKNKKKEELD